MTREWTTPRLRLTPVALTDAEAFVALESALRAAATPPREAPDRATWAGYLAQFVAAWSDAPLGYWTACRDGAIVGFGGVKPKRWRGRECWNLYYRPHADQHGQGLATELARAAVAAIAVAARAGLTRRPELDDDGWAVLLLEP